MKAIDKVLLVLLILLMPIGLFVSAGIFEQKKEAAQQEILDAKKVEELIEKALNQDDKQVEKKAVPFEIGSVVYASESAEFTIYGRAPRGDAAVLVTASILPDTNTRSNQRDGQVEESLKVTKVETLSVLPGESGGFILKYQLDEILESAKYLEFRLEQNESVATVRFDLINKRQIL